MSSYKDLREFAAMLKDEGQFKDVNTPINVARETNELQALMRYLANQDGPALMLHNLEGYNTPDIPVLFNPFGTRERTSMTMGLRDPLETKMEHARLINAKDEWKAPVILDRDQAPCKEVVIEEKDIDMRKQIPHVWFGKEQPSFITNAVTVSHDPETGERNVGWYRYIQFMDAEHPTGESYSEEREKQWLAAFFWWNPPASHIGFHVHKAAQAGKPLEVAIACNVDPAIHLASGTGLSFGEDEYAYAGALKGAPVELVKCDTVDLEVPAHAEFVLEGLCYPDQLELTGRHSNPVGYYDPIGQFPCVKIQHITHRKNPQWYATMEMVPPFDHNYIALLPVEGELLADLKAKIPEVNDVVVTPNMGYIVQLTVDGADKPHTEFGKYVIHAVWGAAGRWARTAKWVTVVGPDVDPYDLASVEWAVMTRVQPYSDTLINKSGQAMVLDVSAPRSEQFGAFNSEQIGIDATIKIPERFKEYAPVSNATPDEVAAIREKLKDLIEG